MSIEFKNVYYTYKKNNEFSNIDVSFKLNEPFFASIIGKTGSGKSTLIQQINGLLLPCKGKIITNDFVIDGENLKKIKNVKSLRKYAALVFQFPEYQLFEKTVLDDVAFGPKNFGLKIEDAKVKAKDALKKVGIGEEYYNKSPFELSGGEKRKVAIAGILALEPKVLIVDEPCAGLDPKSKNEMMDLFFKLFENGTSIIMVSHDMDMVLKYSTTCLVMQEGRLKGQYNVEDLFYNEDLLNSYEISSPRIVHYVKKALKKGYMLDLSRIKDIDSFVNALSEGKLC